MTQPWTQGPEQKPAARRRYRRDAGGPSPVLAVFGDSLSAGYGLPAGQSYPDFLQKKLDAAGLEWRVVNLGISGDTTERLADRPTPR